MWMTLFCLSEVESSFILVWFHDFFASTLGKWIRKFRCCFLWRCWFHVKFWWTFLRQQRRGRSETLWLTSNLWLHRMKPDVDVVIYCQESPLCVCVVVVMLLCLCYCYCFKVFVLFWSWPDALRVFPPFWGHQLQWLTWFGCSRCRG